MSVPDKCPVSDHAVLRYLERVAGVDVEGLRARIWKQTRSAAANKCSSTTVGGIRFEIRDGIIVTVLATKLPEPEPLDG